MSKAFHQAIVILASIAIAYSLYAWDTGLYTPTGNVIPSGDNTSAPMITTVPPFAVQPGQSQTQMMTIQWQGAAKIIINKIAFDSDQGLFKLGKSLPYAAVSLDKQGSIEIPLTVSIPSDEKNVHKVVQMHITALIGGFSIEQSVPVMLN